MAGRHKPCAFVRSPSVEAVELEGEWVLVHGGNRTVTKLNSWGGRVWELLDKHRTAARIADELWCGHDPPAVAAESEVADFLQELQRLGIVEEETEK